MIFLVRNADIRAIAGGMWASSGALILSIIASEDGRPLTAGIALAIGVAVCAASWGRFPPWEGRRQTLKWVLLITTCETLIVAIIWWMATG